jgi:hypothetical protein
VRPVLQVLSVLKVLLVLLALTRLVFGTMSFRGLTLGFARAEFLPFAFAAMAVEVAVDV